MQANDVRQKLNAINISLVNNVEERCQCGFSLSNIVSPKLRCFEESEDAVTYRAEVTGTPLAPSSQIASFVEEWLAGSALISFDFVIIPVDGSCQVVVSSIADPECNTPTTATTGLTTEATSSSPVEQSGTLAAIVGGVLGGVIITLVVVLSIVVVIIVLVRGFRVTKANRYVIGDIACIKTMHNKDTLLVDYCAKQSLVF